MSTTISEYAFSGSLCRIREFETEDGARYCLTIFSLSDYKHLHFPHDDYKLLIIKLNVLLSPHAVVPIVSDSGMSILNECKLSIRQFPFDTDFKIKFGIHRLSIGPVTAFGLVKTSPFTDVDGFSVNKNHFTCDFLSDICICKSCPVFIRLIEYEANAFLQRRPDNVIFFQD